MLCKDLSYVSVMSTINNISVINAIYFRCLDTFREVMTKLCNDSFYVNFNSEYKKKSF